MLSETERQALIATLNEDQRLALFVVVNGLSEQPHQKRVNSPAILFGQALNLLSQNHSFKIHTQRTWIKHVCERVHIYAERLADFNHSLGIRR